MIILISYFYIRMTNTVTVFYNIIVARPLNSLNSYSWESHVKL